MTTDDQGQKVGRVPRVRVPTRLLAKQDIGQPLRRRGLTGYKIAQAIFLIVRTLYLREYPDSFTAREELEERRFRIDELGLHLTVFGAVREPIDRQEQAAADAWYVRIARLGRESSYHLHEDGRSAGTTWHTFLLDYDPHGQEFPLELEVHGEPEFHDGDWLDKLWSWLAQQSDVADRAEEATVLERAKELAAKQTRVVPVSPPPLEPASPQANSPEIGGESPADLYQRIQELVAEMSQIGYADLHPMEAAIEAFLADAAEATLVRKRLQTEFIKLHAQAVPAFGVMMRSYMTSDDAQWLNTEHWLTDLRGTPVTAPEQGGITQAMMEASEKALAMYRTSWSDAERAEHYAIASAQKLCGMAPGGHIFLAKDPAPQACTRCHMLWYPGQLLRAERPPLRSAPLPYRGERTPPNTGWIQ